MKRFRPARARAIGERCRVPNNPEARALDVGGGSYPWDTLNPSARIIILNKSRPHTVQKESKWEYIVGDGTNLQYRDQSFDLVVSNSVIEHVGGLDTQ